MEKIKNFIKNHFDFRFYNVTYIALLVGLAIIPCLMFMPQKYGYENGLLENIQMCVLFVIFGLCVTSKINKRFFNFCALALTLIMLREVNLGRTLFFKVEGTENTYLSWREIFYKGIPVGKVVHGTYGVYIGIVALIFIIKKIYRDLWQIVKNVKFPVWNILFACFAMFMGAIAEKATNNNFIFEEGFELLFYVALAGIVYLYSRNENFKFEIEE